MKKSVLLILSMLLILSGCSARHTGDPGAASDLETPAVSDNGEIMSARDNVTTILNENAETLTKYINADGNGLISLFGLDDIMTDIKSQSRIAVDRTAVCCPLVEECTNLETLQQYYDKFTDAQLRLSNDRDKIKEAKKAGDIDTLKLRLDDLLSVIKDYNKILEQFEEELK